MAGADADAGVVGAVWGVTGVVSYPMEVGVWAANQISAHVS